MVTSGLAVALIGPSTSAGAIFFDIRIGETAIWSGSVMVALVVAAGITYLSASRRIEPLRTYARGEEGDAAAAWNALVRLPSTLGARALVAIIPLSLVGSLPVVLRYADLGPFGVAGLVYSYLVVSVAGVTLLITGAQLLVEAPTLELSERLNVVDVPPSGSWTIRRRLVVITFVSITFAGVATAGAVLGTAATENDYVIAFVVVTAMAAYLLVLLDNGVFRPTVQPVYRLIDATARVRRGDLSKPVPVTTVDEMGQLAAAFNEMQGGLRDRAALHAAFGSYVDPVLAQRLIDSGSAVFEGEELVVTVLFADVRSFTTYSEGVSPAQAVALLNRLFDVMVPVIEERGGHTNHYLGDGLLAVFGAPNPLELHADAALAAAVEIQRRVRADLGDELRIGIGINTGPVIAGTVGGGGRLEFTVIGDTVNVAARVEAITKDTGDTILITDATRTALSAPRPRSNSRGEFQVRGKARAVLLHGVNPFPRAARRSTR